MAYEYSSLDAIKDHILVIDMEGGEKVTNGIIRLDDTTFNDYNIKPRWAKVYRVGPKVDFVSEGEYVLISHGQWTKRIEITVNNEKLNVQKIKSTEILLVSSEKPY